jgi:hypothetical protein
MPDQEARPGQGGKEGGKEVEEEEDSLLSKLSSLPDSLKRAIVSAREQAEADGKRGRSSTSTTAVPPPPQAQQQETKMPPPTTASQPPPPFTLRRGGAAIVDGFAPPAELPAAALEAKALLDAKARPAGMGALGNTWHAKDKRGDESVFLSPADAPPALAALARRLAALGPALRAQGADWADLQPGGRVELQLARYVGVGDDSPPPRYVRHADNNAGGGTGAGAARRATAVLYLPGGACEDDDDGGSWDASRDGGELALYLPGVYLGGSGGGSENKNNGSNGAAPAEPALRVAPLAGRLVLFDSAVEHEVLPVTARRGRARVALTAWFHASAGGGAGAAASPPQPLPPPPPQPQQQPSLVADLAAPILVTVASYRDPETPWTLRDLFAKAADPARVRCAVVWQGACGGGNGNDNNSTPNQKPSWWPRDQVREVFLPGDEACGPAVARHLALAALWRGEPLVLQVDSHTRFRERWDEALTLMLRAAEREAAKAAAVDGEGLVSRGAVISTYPPPYEGAGAAARVPSSFSSSSASPSSAAKEEEEQDVTALCATGFSERDGLLRMRCRRVRPSAVPKLAVGRGPDPDDPSLFCPGVLRSRDGGGGGAFWAAGFSYARFEAAALVCCPRLRHLFFGEEAYGLARLYTAGYDVFAPARCVAWHQWGETRGKRAERAAAAAAAAAVDEAGGSGAAAGAKTYAALVAGDAQAQRERAASERRVRRLLAGGEQVGLGGAAERARPALEPLWWGGLTPGGGAAEDDDSDPDWRPGGRWGLGTARPLQALYARCGVDFSARRVSEGARRGGLPPGSFEDE